MGPAGDPSEGDRVNYIPRGTTAPILQIGKLRLEGVVTYSRSTAAQVEATPADIQVCGPPTPSLLVSLLYHPGNGPGLGFCVHSCGTLSPFLLTETSIPQSHGELLEGRAHAENLIGF